MIKAARQQGIDMLCIICNKVWHSGKWSDDCVKSIFVQIHKKEIKTKYSNYRTTELILHASKVLLWVNNKKLNFEQTGWIYAQ